MIIVEEDLDIYFAGYFRDVVLDSFVVAKRGVKYGAGVFSQPPKTDYDSPDTSLAEQYLEDRDAYMENLDKK